MKNYHVEVHYTAIVQAEFDAEALREALYVSPYDDTQVRGLKMRVNSAKPIAPEPAPAIDQPDGSAI